MGNDMLPNDPMGLFTTDTKGLYSPNYVFEPERSGARAPVAPNTGTDLYNWMFRGIPTQTPNPDGSMPAGTRGRMPAGRGGTMGGIDPRNVSGAAPTLPAMQGGAGRSLGDFTQQTSNTFFDLLGGNPQPWQQMREDLRQAGMVGLRDQQADIRERLGGLGMRFSTAVPELENRAARDLEAAVTGATAPLAFQGLNQAKQQQQQMLGTAFQLPAMMQGMVGQAEQQRLFPFMNALSYATGFAPVGQSSNQKGAGGSIASMGGGGG